MQNTSIEQIVSMVQAQRKFMASGATMDLGFRREMLRKMSDAMDKWERPLADALWQDLHKSYEEAYITELSIVKGEIRNHLKHLKSWARPRIQCTPLKMFPSVSRIVRQPLGNTLIVAPWNYPVQLLLNPLVGAISAGCTAILKPSPYVPHVSAVLQQMIAQTFPSEYIGVVQGNRDVNKTLLEQRFDLIFFTGSPALGHSVMQAAARYLTPVVLELGGKSPCIVDRGADIRVAAKRIAWGKTLNAGQTCIAPDYLLIHESLKEDFVSAFAQAISELHGTDIRESRHYVRLVNERAFERVRAYMADGKILYGGRAVAEERFIEPTLLDVGIHLSAHTAVDRIADKPVLRDEIFGPVLPVITFSDRDEAVQYVVSGEKPLALYYFGSDKNGWKTISQTLSGGACINDTIMHIANENIPFGGVGNSGMGRYHGKESFDTFSHCRSVVSTATWIDLPFRYMPYKMFGLVKRII